jgi:ABC-type nitrate/sulfonate/bicarbonate transport system permease component
MEKWPDLGHHSGGEHVLMSLSRWAVAYCIAAITGLFIGMLLGAHRIMHRLFMPAVYVLQLIPGLAWIPIAILMFGIGEITTIFMIFITALPPIVISTTGGIMAVPRIYINVARMIGLRGWKIFFKVLLPASLISIINGLRIGFANGWRVLIAAEMIVGVSLGLGYCLIQARWSLDFEAALVCIIIICVIGLLVEKILL